MGYEEQLNDAQEIMRRFAADPFGQSDEDVYRVTFVQKLEDAYRHLTAGERDQMNAVLRTEFGEYFAAFHEYHTEWRLWCAGSWLAWREQLRATIIADQMAKQMRRPVDPLGAFGRRRVQHLQYLRRRSDLVTEPQLSAGIFLPIEWCFKRQLDIGIEREAFLHARVQLGECVVRRYIRESLE